MCSVKCANPGRSSGSPKLPMRTCRVKQVLSCLVRVSKVTFAERECCKALQQLPAAWCRRGGHVDAVRKQHFLWAQCQRSFNLGLTSMAAAALSASGSLINVIRMPLSRKVMQRYCNLSMAGFTTSAMLECRSRPVICLSLPLCKRVSTLCCYRRTDARIVALKPSRPW